MNTTHYLPEEELVEQALQALLKALGPVETMRFLRLPRSHRLDSVERHRRWQETLKQDPFFNQVFGPSPTGE